MEEHKHGETDISYHEKTYDSFISWVTRSAVVSIVVLILMGIFLTY